ncbi:PTS sugar transporter subunit IIB [Tetragenococcus koreensis]|uniref:PTS sugar transporter subunit IIB n=1 Tax=Tetragenococcus koreensis TaxID=290335 RepID=UPI000F4E508C|nr:PTS sugar transporter subunit IIB [Tetragenococcus koreensis]MDN6630061.1 PTS sugar transporter subunit IIB [Staphylococcus equorum]MDN6731000.1 PTS sugar transporter subunit IIB [Atopostipes suicloacalis]AYW46514.1 PTS lactose transporter subunit IIB [Tetragenococcus koreensis]MCF1585342.1 PTS sugar transporter subunit IIB [Tetragenococcus koreensis]MCF1619754.1 PTS sugar transporter subunit IIB [Tetragenococcus koreensis]
MLRIGTACGSGLGSSFMVEMNIEKILKNKNVDMSEVKVDHYDLGNASRGDADIWIVGKDLENSVSHLGDVRFLNSIIDLDELEGVVDQIIKEKDLG